MQSVLVESGEFSKEATSTSLQLREFIIGDGLTWAGSAWLCCDLLNEGWIKPPSDQYSGGPPPPWLSRGKGLAEKRHQRFWCLLCEWRGFSADHKPLFCTVTWAIPPPPLPKYILMIECDLSLLIHKCHHATRHGSCLSLFLIYMTRFTDDIALKGLYIINTLCGIDLTLIQIMVGIVCRRMFAYNCFIIQAWILIENCRIFKLWRDLDRFLIISKCWLVSCVSVKFFT